ncbi:recombinase family protein [Paracoccus hibiscisoli]|uniref:Recombinase family protein n=1 Tax=Paracoccus hibiscisoli TaxID=2023261 RepID=A0A4U0RC98_9RHOB|nr:recombinase family protein [Paracoccus hibiscisoli]TJZ85784.1 recombinase family protein [Paracoccus hibiscisoli]
MGKIRFVSYLRVSTDRQGRSGLGLDAQRQAVADYLNGGSWKLVQEVIEVESGGKNDRPQLQAAIEKCRAYGAKLVVAKIDRLTRDAAFLLNLRDAGIDFVAADMPDANRLTVGIMALVAEQEREAISQRTKAALAAAKAKGTQLGPYRDGRFVGRIGTKEDAQRATQGRTRRADAFARDIQPALLDADPESTASLSAIARCFNDKGVPTPSGRGTWTPMAVARLKVRLAVKG